MKHIRSRVKPVGIFMAVFMFMLSGPFQSSMAAMVGTEAAIDIERAQDARNYLKSLLAREDVQSMLVSQGIDPQEAKDRLDSLTDEEASRVAEQLQELPAAGDSFFTVLLIVVFIVFLILLITDIAGYTDIFPFVK
ncbi:MAG: PA2779 family protein [Desulfobacterales bacterium]